jgi:hypothetical protein
MTISTTEKKMTQTTIFETRNCKRCHGSGRHSFTPQYRDMCFGCGGSGLVYTARGKRQKAFFDSIRIVPASTLAAGAVVKIGKSWVKLDVDSPALKWDVNLEIKIDMTDELINKIQSIK